MLKPNIDELMEKVDSRYTLVMVVAKRARQLIETHEQLIETESKKPISIAVEEFYEDKVSYAEYDPNAIVEPEPLAEEAQVAEISEEPAE
jgi:DNA-directed RNA polymerase subunit omega